MSADVNNGPKVRRFRVDRKVTVGEFLTALTIVISVFGLLNSFSKDRELRERDQAASVRNAAAQTLAKLDRLQELSTSIFQDMQPLFIDVSRELARHKDAPTARDMLWNGIAASRQKVDTAILNENIETGYVSLLGYDPNVRDRFRNALSECAKEEDDLILHLQDEGQTAVFSAANDQQYTPAKLGNRLRATATDLEVSYKQKMAMTLQPLQSSLVALMTKSDAQLLHGTVVR